MLSFRANSKSFRAYTRSRGHTRVRAHKCDNTFVSRGGVRISYSAILADLVIVATIRSGSSWVCSSRRLVAEIAGLSLSRLFARSPSLFLSTRRSLEIIKRVARDRARRKRILRLCSCAMINPIMLS